MGEKAPHLAQKAEKYGVDSTEKRRDLVFFLFSWYSSFFRPTVLLSRTSSFSTWVTNVMLTNAPTHAQENVKAFSKTLSNNDAADSAHAEPSNCRC